MRLRIFFVTITLFCSLLLRAQERYYVTWDYSSQPFTVFVEKAESDLKVKFFFKTEWVRDLRVSGTSQSKDMGDILTNTFKGTSLYYYIDEAKNVVITKGWAVKVSEKAVTEETNYLPPTDYSNAQEDQKSAGNVFVEIGNAADRNKPGDVVVTGYINNKDTKEPVAGVTVFLQKLAIGTISNAYGYYSLTLPRGNHLLQFSFIGMKDKKVNVSLNGSGEMNVEMNSTLIPLKETIVSAQKSVTLQRFEVGAEKINISSFRLLPTSMGESDIIKSVLLIPGVQSVGEGSAGFNVRGGSSDQNLILLYGAPIYNPSHFFGFFSSVNSEIIKDVTLYKGGIPGRYGGRISSVLDIVSKEGNRKEFAGNAGISPITTHLTLEGPIIKDTCTYLLTGRTTYSNWIFGLFDNKALQRSRASFYDLNGKVTYDINKNNKLDISGYYSNDSFRFNSDTVYTYQNNIVVARWRHYFNSRFFSHVSLGNSNYRYGISSEDVPSEAFLLSHKINSTGLKADFNLFQGRNEINFGSELTFYGITPGSYLPSHDSSLVLPDMIPRERALESALYVEDKFTIASFFSVNIGLRFSTFQLFGPGDFYMYNPDYPRSKSTITDTVSYKSGEVASSYAGPEIRASFNFRLTDRTSFKINYNRTRQYLHLLSNTTSISPTDTWKLSDFYLKPQIGDQVAAGFYKMFYNSSFEVSTEVYYKEIKNMVDFKGGTKLIMNKFIEKDLVNVKGKAYGVELSVKKTEGKLRYSIGYTYARTFIKSIGLYSDEIINGGKWFPANFDKPNDLVVTMNYIYSRRYSFSANYTWSTGRPITYPIASYHISDKLLVHYSERNKYRIPDYSRLDMSFRINGNLKSRKIAHPAWTFSVYNLLGRQNVYSIYFRQDGNVVNGYKLSVFGMAIPSVTFSFDF